VINSAFQTKFARIGNPNWLPFVLQSHVVPIDVSLCGRSETALSLWVSPAGEYTLSPLRKQAKVKAMTMEEAVGLDGSGTRIKISTSSWDLWAWVVKTWKK
jgi:hypothetical protein